VSISLLDGALWKGRPRRLTSSPSGSSSGWTPLPGDRTRQYWERYLKGTARFRGVPMAAIRTAIRTLWHTEQLSGWPTPQLLTLAQHRIGQPLSEDKLAATLLLAEHLAGSIVTVQPGDLVTTALAGAAVLAVLAALHKELVFGAFDRGGLAALGYPVLALDVAMLLLVEVTLVTSIPAVAPSWRSPCWWRRRPPPACGPSAWARPWRWPPATASPAASPAWSCPSIGGAPPARPSPWSPPACSPSRCWPPPATACSPAPAATAAAAPGAGVSSGGVRAGR
jgi:ABC 3 transport family